jgi:hypothetical protein
MAKFTGKDMTATFGGVALTCLTGIETNQQADIYTAACAGQTYKSRAVGNIDASFTLNFLLDTTTQATELAAIDPGTTGAFSMSANGTWGPSYQATNAYSENLNLSIPVEGFVGGSVTIGIDGEMTIT